MRAFVTGSCGFLGSTLVDRLAADGHVVAGFDKRYQPANLIAQNLLNYHAVSETMHGCDAVFHLAANADIAKGWENPTRDIQQNILATSNVLEAMRANGIKRIAFASSDAVYGATDGTPQKEDCPWPTQISLYGASKVAAEALIQAYAVAHGWEAYIFRFCPIVGERHTHGHVPDFVMKLLADPAKLEVRGTGAESKCKVYVKDAVEAMLLPFSFAASSPGVHIINVATPAPTSIAQSVKWVCDEMKVAPLVTFLGGPQVGYSDVLWPDALKARSLGWHPTTSAEEGVRRTVRWLLENRWALEKP